jgi:hypothetical protein
MLDNRHFYAIVEPMYVEIVPNRNSPPAILLRESKREGGATRKRTLANLSHWPAHKIEALRMVLRDEPMVGAGGRFCVESSLPHGNVEAVLGVIGRLGLDKLIGSRRTRERDLVVAMVAQRLLRPRSKLATTRLWELTTLGAQMGVAGADVDELYAALDWLAARQPIIEKRLAARHLGEGCRVLYDVSSSYYEGRACPLARFGYSRDGKSGLPSIVYGLMTDAEGRPVAIDVYPGNTADPRTVPDQVAKLRSRFGLGCVVLVGDRGMLTHTQIATLRELPQLGWISALPGRDIRRLADAGLVDRSLFDQCDLAEIASPEFPGERLIVCMNTALAQERRRKRDELLAATETLLEKVAAQVRRRTKTPLSAQSIALKVGRVAGRHKMAKHFEFDIADGRFGYTRRQESIEAEKALDGIYVIRTSEPADKVEARQAVLFYKDLEHAERSFRTLKGLDLLVRPIHHRTDAHVRGHFFVCMLAYYIQWHMRRALAPLLFDDEQLPGQRHTRPPVAPAKPSAEAQRKRQTRKTADETTVHSFQTLMDALATRCLNRCRCTTDDDGLTFDSFTKPTPLQTQAFQLLGLHPVT